jgi:hypothetical protein
MGAGQRGPRDHRPDRRDDRRDRSGEDIPRGDDSALIEALEPGAEGAPLRQRTRPLPSRRGGAPREPIRLSVELLDRVMSTVSDMVLARNELARRLREAPTDVPVDGAFERLSAIIAEMRDAITRTRMQRIENLFVALPRMVRDLSAELGKQVLVDIEGGDVELDREMIEMIRDPLTHIIRNAVDHGIETPAERLKAGKREIGMLAVSARQSGNQILIDIQDDGRGIDGRKLVEKAIAAGLSRKRRRQLSPREQLALIFEAGLSTASEVTAISGRGVGMDVVRSNVERIGGIVEVDSVPGEGTRMTLRVPLTLTIIPALTVSIGAQHFAIPRSAIVEIVRANGESVTSTVSAAPASRRSAASAFPKWRLPTCSACKPGPGRGAQPWSCSGPPAATSMRSPSTRSTTMRSWWSSRPPRRSWRPASMPEPRSPTTAARSCCSTRPASPRSAESSSRRRSAPRASPKSPPQQLRRRFPCFCSAASTAAAGRFGWRSSTGSRKCRSSAVKPGAGQLRVQLGEAILAARRGQRRSPGEGPRVPPQRRKPTKSATPSARSSICRRSKMTSSRRQSG